MEGVRWVRLPIFFLLFSLISCGGGSGGGSNEVNLLPYTGLTKPAVLDSANVVKMTEMATYGISDVSGYPPDISGGSLARKVFLAARVPLKSVSKTVKYADSRSEIGNCGGQMNISITGNEATGAFSATIVALGFCEDGETMDGSMNLSGQFANDMSLSSMAINFALVTITNAVDDVTISGTISETFTGMTTRTTLGMNLRENKSGKVYRLENYVITSSDDSQVLTENMTGRFYHPDYGYVDVATTTPFSFVSNDNFPFSGQAVCTGASGTQSRFSALSSAAYLITGNFDGVGNFDDFTTGVVHYPGRNNLPVIFAGNDLSGSVGCGAIAIPGATAVDMDTDTLILSWTFVSKPGGSEATLDGANTLTPSMSPDLAGQYVLRLSVSDGIGTSVEDTVTVTVYGDLFCLKGKTFIPAAQASKPSALAIGDVTGDGRNDVVFVTSSTNSVGSDPNQDYHLSVFAQTAQGTLAAPVTYAAGDGSSLAIADLNGDGRKDVAVSTRTGVGLFYQTSQGILAAMQLLPFGETIGLYEPHSVVAADFTGDGRMDIVSVYSDFTAAKIRLYAQTQSGGFGAPTLFTTDPGLWLAKAVDFNGDQKTDLLLASHEQGKGSVYIGVFAKSLLQSGGTLTAPASYLFDNSLSPGIFCSPSFALANLTGDARPDVLASCLQTIPQTTQFLRLYPQQADGTAGSPVNLMAPATYSQLEAVDLTGDAVADVIGLVSGNQMVLDVFRQTAGWPGAAESYPAGMPNYNYSSQAFALGDINSDGYPDIVTAVFLSSESGNGLQVIPGNPGRR